MFAIVVVAKLVLTILELSVLLIAGSAAELVFYFGFILLKKSGEVNKFYYALLLPPVLLLEDDAWNEKRELCCPLENPGLPKVGLKLLVGLLPLLRLLTAVYELTTLGCSVWLGVYEESPTPAALAEVSCSILKLVVEYLSVWAVGAET